MGIWSAHREVDNSQSVIASMASAMKVDLSASFKFNSGNPVNDAKSVAPALEQSAQSLDQIQDMRRALSASLENGGMDQKGPQAAEPFNPMSFFKPGGMGLSVATTAAGLALGGPVGGAILAVGAVSDAIGFMAGKTGTEHAGLSHAGTKNTAIDGGKSEFTSAPSKDEKGGYVDVLGTRWGDDGIQVALNNQHAPQQSATGIDPRMQRAADDTVTKFGEAEVMKQLGQTSTIEKRLLQQAGSAMDFAELHGGPQKVDMNYRPFAGGPAGPRL